MESCTLPPDATGDRAARPGRRRGLVVVVAGPDGSGKTALCDRLQRSTAGVREVVRLHGRASVFPVRRHGTVVDPHRDPTYSRALSTMKLLYLFLDFWLGWWLWLRPVMRRGGWIIVERGWWDIAVDPRRYRLRVPQALVRLLGRMQPAPDLFLILEAPVDVLTSRKAELPRDELARQTQAWRELPLHGVAVAHLDASRPLADVLADAMREVERITPQRERSA